MLSLQDREWKAFLLKDIFTINATSSSIDKNNLLRENGAYPYVTRTDTNNGISSFVIKQPDYRNDASNCITVGLDTQTVFYQENDFYTGQNIQVLRNNQLNSVNSKFLIPLVKNVLSIFSWGGNGATLTRLRRSKIVLPVNEQDHPDYAFMEQYIRERESQILQNYIVKIETDIQGERNILPLGEKEWKEFYIGDIFTLIPGKGKGANHLESNPKGLSYLGATNRNNGVMGFVSYTEDLVQEGNCIAFIRNGEGSMGYSVYKAESFIATSDITVGYSPFLNRYTGLFLTVVADKVRGKYNFNYKRSDTRLKKELLQLPVNDKGLPDWEYMELYARNLFNRIKLQYLKAKASEY